MDVAPSRWSSLLALLIMAGGCGPALRQSEDFTPERVHEVMFEDVCQLQPYFDTNPGALQQVSSFSVSGKGPHSDAGGITFRLRPGPQTEALSKLVRRLYKRAPPLGRDHAIMATVIYHINAKRRIMPINAVSTIAVDGQEFELPYHPCLGAFFFGREYYQIRGRSRLSSFN